MEIWVTKTLGGLRASDEEAERAFEKHSMGSTFPIDVPVRLSRSGAWHRKYWQLICMIAQNVESVEVEPGLVLPIKGKDDAHVAMKYLTGLFDSYALPGGVVRVVKSTAFDAMSADEWSAYWVRVLDAVHQKILPGISIASVEDELARMAA